jgi:hypothetical protein
VDWNEDGKKDLITGDTNGNIHIFLNTNTDADPQFSGSTFLLLGGVKYDCGYYSCPHIVDWNEDGKKDVLCGDSLGNVQLLINEGTQASPVFNAMVLIQDGMGNLDAGSRVSPTTVDLNRDGKKDLLVGEMYGNIFYYENQGTNASPAFKGGTKLKTASGQIIDVEYYARIDVTDWNNDGIIDILSGNRDYNTGVPSGGVWYFECVGPLSLDRNAISAGTGGTVQITLDAGAANSNRTYYLLGSLTGTEPGTLLPGGTTVLPINWDHFTNFMIPLLNSLIFENFVGVLDASGIGKASLNAPPLSNTIVGEVMSYAFALNSPWDYASNGANIEIIP